LKKLSILMLTLLIIQSFSAHARNDETLAVVILATATVAITTGACIAALAINYATTPSEDEILAKETLNAQRYTKAIAAGMTLTDAQENLKYEDTICKQGIIGYLFASPRKPLTYNRYTKLIEVIEKDREIRERADGKSANAS
jgi:parvulin-like peptidyl-prolyl isomerase